jgi:Kae1-associated kinase Bud32
LDFPELSYELHIKPEYFMYETMMSRARLFPPLVHTWLTFARRNETERNSKGALKGFLEALDELEKEGSIDRSDGYVKISGKLAAEAKTRRVRFVNLLKPAHRALFASVLGVFPNILNILSQNREMLPRFQRAAEEDSKIIREMETPDNYVCVPTARGLVPLADRTDIKAFARRILGADKNAGIVVERLGGVLNDVYLVKATVDGEERRVVVKSFRDWSSFKWFPIVLWSIGTRTFAVLGRSRLERECAMNQLLQSEGFDVPTILHISPSERLIFMEYVEGEKLSIVVKRLANSKTPSIMKKHLNTIRRVGKKMAKVHALGIALGDTKPENILIGKNGEIFFMDFEQASRKGDQVWDVAEFLYYTGHDIPALVDVHVAERIAEAFIGGYLEAGGEAETVKKAGNPKYTKVFSVFTLPHIMIVISNVCRRADKLRL